jgi:hypothetical protein
MSVTYFGAGELGNVARFLAPENFSDWGKVLRDSALRNLVKVSEANAKAFNACGYHLRHEGVGIKEGHSKRDIRTAMPKTADREDALTTLRLLRYNCHSNDGKTVPNADTLEALASLLESTLTVLVEGVPA